MKLAKVRGTFLAQNAIKGANVKIGPEKITALV